jgi:hypothetical protein
MPRLRTDLFPPGRMLQGSKTRGDMSDLYWLSDARMTRLEPYFPKFHGKRRVLCPAGLCAAMIRKG